MREKLESYLEKNEYLFFIDDTHLNKNGTEVIAKFISNKNF